MNFYEISKDHKYKTVDYAKGTDWESIKCPKFPGHQRAGNRIGGLRVALTGKKYGDFLWTFLSEWMINDKVAKIFKENKVTGYELKPVEIVKGSLPYKIWEFVVTGKGGEAHKDSGIYLKEYCEYCKSKTYSAFENGIIVDENNWDGSDIFTVVGYRRYILVTERVKDLIEKNKLTGCKFTLSSDLKWPEGVIKP